MRGRPRGLGTAALVDSDIGDHRAGLHRLHRFAVTNFGAVEGSVRRASSIANRCLLKYILIGGDGPSRSPLDSCWENVRKDAMAMATTYAPLPAAEHSAQLRKAVIASTVGTAIEWYDFFPPLLNFEWIKKHNFGLYCCC